MDLGIRGRVAFVAGGSQGLGKAVALELSREGAKVVICALDDPELPKAVEEIAAATGGKVLGVPADVTDRASLRAAFDGWQEQLGIADPQQEVRHARIGLLQRQQKGPIEDEPAFSGELYEAVAVRQDHLHLRFQLGSRFVESKLD